MCYPTTIHHLFFLLCASGICDAQSLCAANTSRGQFVQVGTSFEVVCIIDCRGKSPTIYQDTNKELSHEKVNGTIMHKVQNISRNTTYACTCRQDKSLICGVDVSVGYPPEVPQNVACEQDGESGPVRCTCKMGTRTDLWTTSEFRVRTASGNGTDVQVTSSGPNRAEFDPGSHSEFLVSVSAVNILGRSAAKEINVTLSHIVRPTPPSLVDVTCSSRSCVLLFTNVSCCLNLVVEYRPESVGNWSTHHFHRSDSNHNWSVAVSLEPFVLYHFRGRLKSRPHVGLWSHWSDIGQRRTEEEAPSKLDVWYMEESPRTYILLWKKLSLSEAKGNITGYTVLVENTKTKKTQTSTVRDDTSFTTDLCPECFISISAVNSKGRSPPANLSIPREYGHAPQIMSKVAHSNGSIALSWNRPVTAAGAAVTGYLVEWLLAEGNYKGLQWERLHRDQHSIHITGLKPHDCYKGAVYTLFKDGRGKTEFDISYQPKVPDRGPGVIHIRSLLDEDNAVQVTWSPVQRPLWRGCLTKYTIYIEGPNGEKLQHEVKDIMSTDLRVPALIPGQKYTVYMTAWNAAGESSRGDSRVFTLKSREEQSQLFVGIVVTIISMAVLLVALCLCQAFSLRRRCLTCCHLLPDMVPDPANSKWAKECSGKMGDKSLQLYLSVSDMSVSEEEEPDTLEVQEMSRESLMVEEEARDQDELSSSSRRSSLTQRGRCVTSYTLNCPPSAYLKSYSQESDETQASRSTELTVDYLSTPEMLDGDSDAEGGRGEEEEEEGDEEDEEEGGMGGTLFLPCPLFHPGVSFGGRLTLDSVKVDCGEFGGAEPFILHI